MCCCCYSLSGDSPPAAAEAGQRSQEQQQKQRDADAQDQAQNEVCLLIIHLVSVCRGWSQTKSRQTFLIKALSTVTKCRVQSERGRHKC